MDNDEIRDEIKVGEYARTDNGLIIKVDFIDYNDLCVGTKGVTYDFEDIEEMNNFIKTVKHNSNIFKLIEKGDFINKKCIEKIAYYDDHIDVIFINEMKWYGFDDEKLKECFAVTKEQFQSVEFRLEE